MDGRFGVEAGNTGVDVDDGGGGNAGTPSSRMVTDDRAGNYAAVVEVAADYYLAGRVRKKRN